jgi:hypothetical protein
MDITTLSPFVTHFACGGGSFFGLVPWYQYLTLDGTCNVSGGFQVLPESGVSDLLLVALAIVDDLLRIAGLVAVGYIIYGGIMYTMSQGSPDQTGKAQNTIINALIGLVIATLSVAIVTFVGNRIG